MSTAFAVLLTLILVGSDYLLGKPLTLLDYYALGMVVLVLANVLVGLRKGEDE